jgi:hypothetical protein
LKRALITYLNSERTWELSGSPYALENGIRDESNNCSIENDDDIGKKQRRTLEEMRKNPRPR